MNRSIARYAEAAAAVAAVAWLSSALLPVLGLASAALLFLLPVLLAATRGGVGPALVAALGGATAYNFFLLEPRYTFRVHQLDNLVSVVVLVAVALVTSRLATRLTAREAEANTRAGESEEAARLSAVLAAGPAREALRSGLAFVGGRYGPIELIEAGSLPADGAAFSSLDLSAAAWALHNGDVTGHGTETMAAAEWTFLPLAPRSRQDAGVAALARPGDGATRGPHELARLQQLALLLGQGHDRVRLEAERRERELLEQSEGLRRTFLASLAHDFRTPLTVITGRLELLAAALPEATDALVAARRLDRTMADLLGAARIEDGSLAPRVESLDLVDAVAAVCDGLAVPHGIAVHRSIPANLPFVAADPVLLHHVLANLLDNALRQARHAVQVAARSADGAVTLTVEDDGPGVPPADRERIFERFVRIEGGDRAEGSGLGLAIVRGFADAMGARVTVGDRAGGGASFALALPIARDAPA